MGKPRTDLHAKLLLVCPNTYFKPPENIKLKYPCIIYRRDDVDIKRANDLAYLKTTAYSVTVMDTNADGTIWSDLLDVFPMARFIRSYLVDGVHHDRLLIYY